MTKLVYQIDGDIKFVPGQIVATPALMQVVPPEYAVYCLQMHLTGDWGLVDDEDKATNDAALKDGNRLLSAYALPNDPGNFWIITEWDRSFTTLLLPDEY